MKRKERKTKEKRNSFLNIIKVLIICSIFFFVSMFRVPTIVEGSLVIKEQKVALLEEGESCSRLCVRNGFAYLSIVNTSQVDESNFYMQIFDVRQIENPVRLGKYEMDPHEFIVKLEVRNNIAYLLRVKTYHGVGNWTVTLLNITEPANPVQIGSTVVENVTQPAIDIWDFTIHNNYMYVSTDSSLEIIDCSNPTLPVKVANHTSLIGNLLINNNYLYIVSGGVRVYDLLDPINPVFLGEVNGTKHTAIAGCGVFGNYVIKAFWWSGLQAYNLTDPYHPTICGNYEFPDREFSPGGLISDMEIVEDKLFAGGRKLYVFDISNPQDLRRIARKNTGGKQIFRIASSENYIYATFGLFIKIYSYEEKPFWRNLGLILGIGFGIPILVLGSLLILKKRRS